MEQTQQKKVYKLPKEGLHLGQIFDVKYENKLPGYKDPSTGVVGEPKDRVTLRIELQGPENLDDEGKPIQITEFINEVNWIHFTKSGESSPTTRKFGTFLEQLFGELPSEVKWANIDFQALAGCYVQGFIKNKKKAQDKVFPKFMPFMPLMDESAKEFNANRKGLVIKNM